MNPVIQTEYRIPQPVFYLKDLYPLNFQAPAGYELTGEFRPPQKGDLFLPAHTTCDVLTAMGMHQPNDPRLILRKKAKATVVTFRSTGENRPPLKDEWYRAGRHFLQAGDDHKHDPRDIYTRTETEE